MTEVGSASNYESGFTQSEGEHEEGGNQISYCLKTTVQKEKTLY